MKKLFENVEGNRFKLLTESVNGEEHVISGLKKVFGSDLKEISYKRVETVGLGYIKDVSTAQRISLQEAKRIAESFGFKDDEQNEKFVKENNVETVPYVPGGNSSGEKREVQIGKEIISLCDSFYDYGNHDANLTKIETLANELIKLHGAK